MAGFSIPRPPKDEVSDEPFVPQDSQVYRATYHNGHSVIIGFGGYYQPENVVMVLGHGRKLEQVVFRTDNYEEAVAAHDAALATLKALNP